MKNNESLKAYLFDDGKPFAVIWYNEVDILPFIKKNMEIFNESPIIRELSKTELKEWYWEYNGIISSGEETLKYLKRKKNQLYRPLTT